MKPLNPRARQSLFLSLLAAAIVIGKLIGAEVSSNARRPPIRLVTAAEPAAATAARDEQLPTISRHADPTGAEEHAAGALPRAAPVGR